VQKIAKDKKIRPNGKSLAQSGRPAYQLEIGKVALAPGNFFYFGEKIGNFFLKKISRGTRTCDLLNSRLHFSVFARIS
jgi:hypothetical protein